MSAEPTHCQPHSVAEPCAACNTPRATEAGAIARLRLAATLDEVLDALEAEVPAEARPHCREQADASFDAAEEFRCKQSNEKRARLLAVLAKAGRR